MYRKENWVDWVYYRKWELEQSEFGVGSMGFLPFFFFHSDGGFLW